MQQVLLYIHSWVRWLIVLVALIALVKHIIGLARRSEYDSMTRGLMSAFSGLMDLQVVIGIIQLIVGWQAFSAIAGGFPRVQIKHLTVMLIAAIIAHLPMRWKDKPAAIRYRNSLVVIVVVAVLIVVGVMVLAGSRWVFRI